MKNAVSAWRKDRAVNPVIWGKVTSDFVPEPVFWVVLWASQMKPHWIHHKHFTGDLVQRRCRDNLHTAMKGKKSFDISGIRMKKAIKSNSYMLLHFAN